MNGPNIARSLSSTEVVAPEKTPVSRFPNEASYQVGDGRETFTC